MNIIFWFSGTGNSRAIATALASELGETELAPLAVASPELAHGKERVGIVFPVYAFGMPAAVAAFLSKLPESLSAYVFTIANAAGMIGAPHAQARRLLSGRGIELAASWSLFMPGNYPILAGAPSESKQKKMFEKTKSRIPAICAAVNAKSRAGLADSFPPLNWLASLVNPMAMRSFKTDDKSFRAKDNCIHCGVCAKVCPVSNIKMEAGKPLWQGHCEQCMACLQWCPVEAIESGTRTVGRKRYRHPDFKAADLFLRQGGASAQSTRDPGQ